MPKVATVIPSFNHARYISAALDSVLNQTLPPDLLVVVDDGSTDESPALLRQYAADNAHRATRIELIFQANAGAHNALNRGILAAGEVDYVAILNSDDLFEPARLERCVAFLEQHPEFALACTGLRLIDSDGAFLGSENGKVRRHQAVWAWPERDPAAWLGLANFTKTTSNFVIRGDYARRHPLRGYRYVHDYFFAIIAAVEGKLGVIPEPLLRYRTHTTNTIKKDGAAKVRSEVVRMNLEALRALQPLLSTSATARAAYTRYFRVAAENHTDLRAEVLLAVLANMAANQPDGEVESLLHRATPECFPELEAGSNKDAFVNETDSVLAEARKVAASSRWLILGIALGFVPNIFTPGAGADGRSGVPVLERLKRSPWVVLGQRLGLVGKIL